MPELKQFRAVAIYARVSTPNQRESTTGTTLRRTIYEHSFDAITVWPKGPMKRDLFRVMGEFGGSAHWGGEAR